MMSTKDFLDLISCSDKINIHEFAHACKQLAFKKGYILSSGLTENGKYWCDVSIKRMFPMAEEIFIASSEPEAIIEALNYVEALSYADKEEVS